MKHQLTGMLNGMIGNRENKRKHGKFQEADIDIREANSIRREFERADSHSEEEIFLYTEAMGYLIRETADPHVMMALGGFYYQKRNNIALFRSFWLYILLSFLFYIPVAVFAGLVPMLGMLMLPKTVCYIFYILMILVFLRAVDR